MRKPPFEQDIITLMDVLTGCGPRVLYRWGVDFWDWTGHRISYINARRISWIVVDRPSLQIGITESRVMSPKRYQIIMADRGSLKSDKSYWYRHDSNPISAKSVCQLILLKWDK